MRSNLELIDKLIFIAAAQVGVKEEGGNNCGLRIREYQKATWLEPGAWAWCAALQCWLLREWLRDTDVCAALNIPVEKVESWRCQDASAFGWEKWAKGIGLKVLPETAKAKKGDIVIFDFSHIGIVAEDQGEDYICTIEGNTNGKGERDSVTGDGVWRKKRPQSLTKCYIRFLNT